MYIHDMGKMAAEPYGAADTVRLSFTTVPSPSPPHGTTG